MSTYMRSDTFKTARSPKPHSNARSNGSVGHEKAAKDEIPDSPPEPLRRPLKLSDNHF